MEEYSIDECFAEITGLHRPLKKSYSAIVAAMKHDLDTELGVTFSVGLAPTKVLAKNHHPGAQSAPLSKRVTR